MCASKNCQRGSIFYEGRVDPEGHHRPASETPTLNSGLVALEFYRGSGPVSLRNPIFCYFSGGPSPLCPPLDPRMSNNCNTTKNFSTTPGISTNLKRTTKVKELTTVTAERLSQKVPV